MPRRERVRSARQLHLDPVALARHQGLGGLASLAMRQIQEPPRDACRGTRGSYVDQSDRNESVRPIGRKFEYRPRVAEDLQSLRERLGGEFQRSERILALVAGNIAGIAEAAPVAGREFRRLGRTQRQRLSCARLMMK